MNFQPARVLAAVWAAVFAAVHVVWAGGSASDRESATGPAPAGPVGYDVVVAVGCLVALVVALWGRRWMLMIVAALLLVRGGIGIGQIVVGLVQGVDVWSPLLWIEPVFVLGGVAFAVAAGRRVRAHRDEHVAVNG